MANELVAYEAPALDFEAANVWIKTEGWRNKTWTVWVELIPSQAQLRIIGGSTSDYSAYEPLRKHVVFYLHNGVPVTAHELFKGGRRYNAAVDEWTTYHSWLHDCNLQWHAELIAKNAQDGINEYREEIRGYRAALRREWERKNPSRDHFDNAKRARIARALSDET